MLSVVMRHLSSDQAHTLINHSSRSLVIIYTKERQQGHYWYKHNVTANESKPNNDAINRGNHSKCQK